MSIKRIHKLDLDTEAHYYLSAAATCCFIDQRMVFEVIKATPNAVTIKVWQVPPADVMLTPKELIAITKTMFKHYITCPIQVHPTPMDKY
jgi:hypothetical protein